MLANKKNALTRLKGNGDFRSEECIELLKEADIVCTNPPFSLFREYIAQLIKYDKKFVVVGNQNAINYKETFSLIQENKLWLGRSLSYIAFKVPEYYEEKSTRFWIDDTGQKWRSMGNVCWYTNLDHKKRHEKMILYRNYSSEAYPHYDNYDAIEVSKVVDIPCDYDGVMGVPITFMDKYNPEQFEILGLSQKCGYGLKSNKKYDTFKEVKQDGTLTGSSGKKTNGNPVMKGKPLSGNYYTDGNEFVYSLYGRIFIRRKK